LCLKTSLHPSLLCPEKLGEDNSSRYSHAEVREYAKESDVQVYGIGELGKLAYGNATLQGAEQQNTTE
jgi:hypothetical protein